MWAWLSNYLFDAEFNRKRKFLQRVSLFQDIPRREFGYLFRALVARNYNPGEILFREGEIGRALFILERGLVEVTRQDANGEPARVAILHPGDYFGEMSIMDERPRTATVAAMEPVRVFLLYKTELEKLVREAPRVASAIILHLAMMLTARIRSLTESAPYSIAAAVKIKEAP
jgi:CRP/FNR family transcriptional regulator, cyclic AMP receptor protein